MVDPTLLRSLGWSAELVDEITRLAESIEADVPPEQGPMIAASGPSTSGGARVAVAWQNITSRELFRGQQ